MTCSFHIYIYIYSLPSKLTKATDFPVFGSANHSLYNKSKDGTGNGGSHSPTSSNVSLSRFSSQTMDLSEETRKDESLYHQSPLSHKVSVGSEELGYETKSVEKEKGETLTNNSQIADSSKNHFQFHFSIYKWSGKGVPLSMSVLENNKLRYKYRSRMERSSSSNGRVHCDSTVNRDLSVVENKVERSEEIKMKSKNKVKGTDSGISESDNLRSSGHLTPNSEKSHFKDEVDLYEKTEKEAYTKGKQAQNPLKALFNDENQELGKFVKCMF